jgi:hypothetical protein
MYGHAVPPATWASWLRAANDMLECSYLRRQSNRAAAHLVTHLNARG